MVRALRQRPDVFVGTSARRRTRAIEGDDHNPPHAPIIPSNPSGRKAVYRLQIRTGCNFGDQVRIQAHVSQLWFDPHMALGQPPKASP